MFGGSPRIFEEEIRRLLAARILASRVLEQATITDDEIRAAFLEAQPDADDALFEKEKDTFAQTLLAKKQQDIFRTWFAELLPALEVYDEQLAGNLPNAEV